MVQKNTNHIGHETLDFNDYYNVNCSIQKSSLSEKDTIWFGINEPTPQILSSDAKKLGIDTNLIVGWIPFPLPNEVTIQTRMHLTREQVALLIPHLQHFVDFGDLQ